MGLLNNRLVQRLGGGFLEQFAVNTWARLQHLMLGTHKDAAVLRLIAQVRKERRCLLTGFETFLIHSIARSSAGHPGAWAEVGVYEGASTKLICEAKGDRTLHVFDTFTGLPPSSSKDNGVYFGKKPMYASSLESVKEYLQAYPNVHFHPGLFPDTAGPVEHEQFAFVHIDVDLYESTLACLEFFYPRMLPGAILVSHDYSLLAGVRSAFTEFFADKQERVLELSTTQAMFIKLAPVASPGCKITTSP